MARIATELKSKKYRSPIKNFSYGVVYTPPLLADFVSRILIDEITKTRKDDNSSMLIVDPACGENALLKSIHKINKGYLNFNYVGVDVDSKTILHNKNSNNNSLFIFDCFDSILPSDKICAKRFWQLKFDIPDVIISNPPWSSNRLYDKSVLSKFGYELSNGQYDSYELFIELCQNIVKDGGFCAYILPDSVFSDEKSSLRKFLLEKTSIKVIARLGEKLFDGVHRATTIIITKKELPSNKIKTKCFRLTTDVRNNFLNNNTSLYEVYLKSFHVVEQSRFLRNPKFNFDVDTQENEEVLIRKIEQDKINWNDIFKFNRGVEISKLGLVIECPHCGITQGVSRKQIEIGHKKCKNCSKNIDLLSNQIEKVIQDSCGIGYEKIYVGENIQRYHFKGNKYLLKDKNGIDYKNSEIYLPPKILIRKTGLGINACIDYNSTYVSQTVYSCNYITANRIPLEYYLGVLNSRVMFYYYLKQFGENEWKSHPYLTKEIIFSLPIRNVNNKNFNTCLKIAELTKLIMNNYTVELDFAIEELVYKMYELSKEDIKIIKCEINKLPNLGAINHMKYRDV